MQRVSGVARGTPARTCVSCATDFATLLCSQVRIVVAQRFPSPGKPPPWDRVLRKNGPRRVSAEQVRTFAEVTIIFPPRRFFLRPFPFCFLNRTRPVADCFSSAGKRKGCRHPPRDLSGLSRCYATVPEPHVDARRHSAFRRSTPDLTAATCAGTKTVTSSGYPFEKTSKKGRVEPVGRDSVGF